METMYAFFNAAIEITTLQQGKTTQAKKYMQRT